MSWSGWSLGINVRPMPLVILMSWGHSWGICFREGFGSEVEEEKGLEPLGKIFL